MKNKKGMGMNGLILTFIGIFLIAGLIIGGVWFVTTQSGVGEKKVEELAGATKQGDIAKLGIYVRDVENNNPNTKVAVPIYCKDEDGKMLNGADGTTSSTTSETSVSSTIGSTATCYAFNSTYNTVKPVVVSIEDEYTAVTIDAYKTLGAGYGQIVFYDDGLNTGTGGALNLTGVGASQTGTFQKMRFKNNGTDVAYNLGGFYFNTQESANVSNIDISGGATLHGMTKTSTQVLLSTIGTRVTSRQSSWDFRFEIDDNPSESGNQPLYMQESDYLETGSMSVEANGNGCGAELISSYAFQKGYYRSISDSDPIGFGYETDAQSPSSIGTDITGDTFYCTA